MLAAALALPPEQRSAFVDAQCGADDPDRRRLLELLRLEDDLGDFLTAPPSLHVDDGTLRPDAIVGGRYRLVAPLARPAAGAVFRAFDTVLHRDVALKVAPWIADSAGRRWLREATATADVHHPHLAEVYDAGFDAPLRITYYVERLLRGCTLRSWLLAAAAASPPDAASRRAIAARVAEVASAVAALHGAGRVHGDVSPNNVMLEERGDGPPESWPASIYDYGLVREIGSAVTVAFGTPGYVAPEIGRSEHIAPTSDVFALGALLHDAVLGCVPTPTAGLRGRRATPDREAIRRIEPGLAPVLEKALATAPEHRHPDAAALHADVVAWLCGATTSADADRRRRRRRRWARAGRAAMLAGLLAAVTIGWLHARARAALMCGDLWALAQFDDLTPAWSTGWHAHAAALLPPPRVTAIERVVAMLLGDGPDAALLLAARYVERDGIANQEECVRFLCLGIERPATRPSAARALGRAMLDRPDDDAAAVAASGAARSALWRALEGAGTEATRWLLVALAGCATPADVQPLLQLATTGRDDETTRLALRAVRSVLWRWRQCEFAADLAPLLPDLVDRVTHMRSGKDPATSTLLDVERQLTLAESLQAARRLGRPIDTERSARAIAAFARPTGRLRAAARDPGQLDALRAGPAAVAPERHQRPTAFAAYAELVAASDDGELALAAPALVDGAAAAWRLDPAAAQRTYSDRYDRDQRSADGRGARDRTDADSRLGEWLTASQAPLGEVIGQPEQSEPPDAFVQDNIAVFARWHFHWDVRQGAAAPCRARACTVDRDAYVPRHSYLRMAIAGASVAEFPFELRRAEDVSAHFQLQRGGRSGLPLGGYCAVAVEIDGVDAGEVRLERPTAQESMLPLGHLTAGEHVLRLRLRDSSTTTLRVYEVTLQP